MIDFEKIVSKYNTEVENEADMAKKVMCVYSELYEAISKELAKTPCRGLLIPAVSAALEVSANGIMLPFKDDKFLCGVKDVLIDGTMSISIANPKE